MPRPSIEWRSASKQNYHAFCKKHSSIKITFEEYLKIIYTYFSTFANHILETGDIVKMPYGLGTLTINKYKKRRNRKTKDGKEIVALAIDWKATMDLWKDCEECKEKKQRVFHLNTHTDGYSYYWMWDHNKSRLRSSFVWKFEMIREHSRKLPELLKKPNSKYKDIYKYFKRKNYGK